MGCFGTIRQTGAGGVGIAGSNLSIVNAGSIIGGTQNDGSMRVAAVALSGSGNRYEMWAGSSTLGSVVVAPGGASNILALGGASSGSFDVSKVVDTATAGMTDEYAGFTGFEKTGSSIWTLTGTSSSAMPLTVNDGTLLVNGSTASSSPTTVNAGGALGGGGTVGNTLVNGGTLSPGNSIGTLTVAGDLVFTSASTYMVEVLPANSDFTYVTGTATLGGATVQARFAPGSYVEKRYTILTAGGGVNGSFSGPVNTNLPANFKSALATDGNNAYLDLALGYKPPQYGNGLNRNQQNVAATLENFFSNTGGIPLSFGALTPRGLSQASGEIATGASQAAFNAQTLFLNALTDPFTTGAQGAAPPPPSSQAMGYAATPHESRLRDAFASLSVKAPPLSAPVFEPRWRTFGSGYGGSAATPRSGAMTRPVMFTAAWAARPTRLRRAHRSALRSAAAAPRSA